MSVEELIEVASARCYASQQPEVILDHRSIAAFEINMCDVLVKYFYDYYRDTSPDIPISVILDSIIKAMNSTELYVVLHYVIEGYLMDKGYLNEE